MKELIDAQVLLRGDLEILETHFLAVSFGFLACHLMRIKVYFIADNGDQDLGKRLLVQLLDPLLALLEGVFIRHVKHDAGSDGIPTRGLSLLYGLLIVHLC